VDQDAGVDGPEYTELKALVKRQGLATVCEEAGCPNIYECWEDREATFLIGGDQCTRRCDFCNIDTGKPAAYDTDEPRRVAESVAQMGLRYATVTGVARDDLPDGGAWLYAETVRQIHAALPGIGVELLIPDFNGTPALLQEVFDSRPEVLAHNVETVPRIFRASARASATSARSTSSPRPAPPGSSPRATSSSAWARSARRSARRCRTCTTPAASSSPSRSTCARRRATTR
jgi:lipoate synthase